MELSEHEKKLIVHSLEARINMLRLLGDEEAVSLITELTALKDKINAVF